MPDTPQPFDDYFDQLLGKEADPVAAGWRLRELADESTDHPIELVTALADRTQIHPLADSDPAILGALLRIVHTTLLRSGAETIRQIEPTSLVEIDASLPEQTPNRFLLLHLLALHGEASALKPLVELLEQSPPQQWIEAAQVLSPLMQSDSWPVEAFFPAALDSLQHPSLASPLLDLANYVFRQQRVPEHPAAERLEMLNLLLGEVTGRLSLFEENPRTFGDDVETVQARLGEAVSLAVSLCDTVGLIGNETSVGKLNQTIQLKHRRVQCEAAGALARLEDEAGRKRLLELTADPAARLRAVHYAEELGFVDQVEEQYRTDQAIAESEMSLWLAQPQQMGVPPTHVEVVDWKRLLWPSFQDPVDVFLIRFEYNFGAQVYSNVGISGPVTFAMSTDVADLPLVDIYAIYAGWHADHDEIFSVSADQLNEVQIRIMGELSKHLEQHDYEMIQPSLLGFFLDEKAGVFLATREGKQCVVVTDGLETIDHPIAGRSRPVTPKDLFNLYKGRKMLRTFNSTVD